MQILEDRILAEGVNLGRGILKVDSLLNHQIDAALMMMMGQEFARRFEGCAVTRILTAEVSGIAPAMMTAYTLGVPMVYARKHKPITMKEPVFVESAPSHTKGGDVHLMVSPEYLSIQDRVLIIDDFLATGKTIAALARLVQNAGATLVGIGTVIEKVFERGRASLLHWNVPIESLAIIAEMRDDGTIVFVRDKQRKPGL
ncbi:MAG: xanthine phosphoribosyltransferase [Anaerolineae bacterium]|nr:xanthine phosphoribosyltransferase [Anaerolineae bacterium]